MPWPERSSMLVCHALSSKMKLWEYLLFEFYYFQPAKKFVLAPNRDGIGMGLNMSANQRWARPFSPALGIHYASIPNSVITRVWFKLS